MQCQMVHCKCMLNQVHGGGGEGVRRRAEGAVNLVEVTNVHLWGRGHGWEVTQGGGGFVK